MDDPFPKSQRRISLRLLRFQPILHPLEQHVVMLHHDSYRPFRFPRPECFKAFLMLLHAPFAAVKGNDIPQINMKQIFHNFYRFDKQRIPRKLGQIAVVAHIKMKIRLATDHG